jgi:4-amino-4-deoxy-L-arabinose transferase-like glycosyltransferase
MSRPANPITRPFTRSSALAALLAALALLPLLGHKPLAEWDEAIYAEVAREMLSRSWLVPHWNQQLWLEKPPLTMWITAALFKLFGVTEFWARATSALSGVALVAVLHRWLARTRDTLTAWLATIMLLATFGFLHACHAGETDIPLALACCLALIGLARIDAHQPRGWYLFWIAFAAALMTKGAAAIVLPLTAVALAATRRWRSNRLCLSFWLGLALFLLLVLPWHIAMYRLFPTTFRNEYLGLHVIARATHQIEGHATHWWFYLKVLLVSAPPFVLLYPIAIAHALRRRELRAWAIFALVVIAFYTAVQTRLPQYIVPAYPALTLLTAIYLADRLKPLIAARRPPRFWITLALIAALISATTILATNSARKSLHSATLADGTILPDNKDSIALLRSIARNPPANIASTPGPLLLWRQGRIISIATDVFYSRRPVQEVEPHPIPPYRPTDRYTFSPVPLATAVTSQPRLILLDRDLIPQLPAAFIYTPIQSAGAVELGSITRTR